MPLVDRINVLITLYCRYMMAEAGSYPPEISTSADLLQNLEFYLMVCSIQQDADQLSIVAGTLANGGVYVHAAAHEQTRTSFSSSNSLLTTRLCLLYCLGAL